jgi:hypothetical protein
MTKRTYIDLTADEISAALVFDHEKGEFYRRHDGPRGQRACDVATRKAAKGYRGVTINGVPVLCHRLVWFLLHGEWPLADVDHEDGDRANNRPGNLRAGSRSFNMQNLKRAHADSASQLLGAYFDKRRGNWTSKIAKDGASRHLGVFESAEAAHAAYVSAKREIHEGCTL